MRLPPPFTLVLALRFSAGCFFAIFPQAGPRSRLLCRDASVSCLLKWGPPRKWRARDRPLRIQHALRNSWNVVQFFLLFLHTVYMFIYSVLARSFLNGLHYYSARSLIKDIYCVFHYLKGSSKYSKIVPTNVEFFRYRFFFFFFF